MSDLRLAEPILCCYCFNIRVNSETITKLKGKNINFQLRFFTKFYLIFLIFITQLKFKKQYLHVIGFNFKFDN